MNLFSNECILRGFRAIAFIVAATIATASTANAQETAEAGSAQQTDKMQEKTMPAETEMAKPQQTRELTIDLAGDTWTFQAPVSWKSQRPRVNFTKHDLQLPKVDSDPKNARLTFTISGGGTRANINRWKSQFKLPVGEQADSAFKMTTKEIDGYQLSMVTIKGTFLDSMGGGPFAGGKKVSRPDYIMRALIMTKEGSTEISQKCFLKLVGPAVTVKKHEKAFDAMIKTMKSRPAKKAS